jgi:integrase
MHIKTPRLFKNRCGVFYFRIKTAVADRRFSLRTKCPRTAAIIALHLNVELERTRAMTKKTLSDLNFDFEAFRRYEIDLKNGVFKASGAEDHRMMMDALERIGPISPSMQPLQTVPATAPAPAKSLPLPDAAELWLAERAKKNAPRTVDAKRYHIADFMRRVARGIEVNAMSKAVMVGYKSALLAEGQTGKTIDNKLMTLHDFFKYLLGHGHYTAAAVNPVDGLFVLSKAERVAKNEPFQPFTEDELRAFFESAAYIQAMDSPDAFWGPLIGVYTGMRISEVAAIRCEDIKTANGVSYIQIPRSKTAAGVRNVPVCQALRELGFLSYATEVRAAGADRIFPHRLLINGTYSKHLSAAMLAYLTSRGIKTEGDRKSFHSFRVNVITAMANNGANTPQVMKIVGHKNREADDVHLGYVRDLRDLLSVVDALTWPINIAALRYDGRFKSFVADRDNWAPPPSRGLA